jgi:23S rRNA (cytosine1962-C5)-methyltransferase
MTSPTIVIKSGREKPIIQQHPWIFSGAIDEVKGDPNPGDIVTVTDKKGRFLAHGYWNPRSQIQVRILTWQDEPIDEAWWHKMLKRAIEGRGIQIGATKVDASNAYRLINAENDFLPGLIVDCYGSWLVLQALTLHIDQQKTLISGLLNELLHPKGIFERSDVDVRGKEGLKASIGNLVGEEPPKYIEILEYGKKILVDVRLGHKTGYYLDQVYNHWLLNDLLTNKDFWSPARNANETSVLNLFSYTGSFGIQALHQASVINVDSSNEALETAERIVQANHPEWLERCEFIQADVFELLRDYASEGKQFDVVVLDPPKFAHNAGQVEKAARGYKDINLNAFKCVKPGGYLMTFSCSGAISADLFQKIVFGALADSGRQAQILKHLGPGDDHPVALTFPEGAYLKGLLLRVY